MTLPEGNGETVSDPILTGRPSRPPVSAGASLRSLLMFAAAVSFGLGIHLLLYRGKPAPDGWHYTIFLCLVLGVAIVTAPFQLFSPRVRRWRQDMHPILTAGALFLCLWEVITTGLNWLPLPYFPGPEKVLRSLISDRGLLFESTWHSLILLLSGYTLGVIVGLISGVCIGWSRTIRYWGMPVLKVIGPIPATAWIPLAMVLSPSGVFSAIGLIALAVWFPVTMLTASGISNTRASYLDVARTLGANERYLIFRVAIPAALPNVFIGLFMGLGASFLTLVVAETVGVKSGLGWYVGWAQGWAEYGKVFAAIVIMAAFFSTIMTALFKLRDRVLVWQKGTIRW
ncbi:MAG TPA: ABC transporter permease [Chthoniobacterales bacterium]|nr:ABC transporter permease [Chthoniobacterales bacterium]